jgi:hypothetical protein
LEKWKNANLTRLPTSRIDAGNDVTEPAKKKDPECSTNYETEQRSEDSSLNQLPKSGNE